MKHDIYRDLLPKLQRDYEFKKVDGNWLQGGKCPTCSKKELFTSKEHPWVLRCGRLERCGAEIHVKDIYPELFENFGDRYPKTPENPTAAADAYLSDMRGFDIAKIAGTYSQESYYDREKKIGSETVRFPIAPGVYWERLIDQVSRFGNKKAHFNYGAKYQGMAWCPPMQMPHDEIWIVEGIFNSIALMHHDIYAASAMSCSNYPHLFLTAVIEQCEAAGVERPKLVWALDDGKAGTAYAKKFKERSEKEGWKSSCVLIRGKGGRFPDWNDQHLADRLQPADIDEYRYHGALLTAKSAADKGALMYRRKKWTEFYFDYDNRLFWFAFDHAKYNAAKETITQEKSGSGIGEDDIKAMALEQSRSIKEIANFKPTALYYLANELTNEAWYYVRIDFPHDGPSIKGAFTAGQLSGAAEFKVHTKHLGPGASFSGSTNQLDIWFKKETYNIKRVKTIDYIGYSIDDKAYVYNNVAFGNGRVVEQNEEDYFDIGNLAIKSLLKSVKLDINADLKAYDASWFDRFYLCFGPKGIVALAAWLGSLFAEQIRKRFASYPFVEIVGEAGAGKSTMIELLWRLLGRNGYEGFDPMKGSQIGLLRGMAQLANLPVVLIESDREDDVDGSGKGRPKQAFHWDGMKTLYNGGSLRTTGVKSSGNDTYDPQFRGALFISQNAPVQASTAIMERIVHIGFDKSRQSEAGREAALELARLSAHDVSGFLVKAITQEAKVLERMETHLHTFEKRLEEIGVRNQRLQLNHAMLMVMVDALALVCPMTESIRVEAIKQLAVLAVEREQALAKDHPAVEQFWEAYEYLNGVSVGNGIDEACEERMNHSRDEQLIAINLNHFVQVAADMRQQIPLIADLKRLLKTSRQRKFVEIKAVNSAINGRYNAQREHNHAARPSTIKCWVFQREKSALRAATA